MLFFASALSAYAQGNVFKHVRYNGGTFYTNVKPTDWHNQLTITSDTITFKLHDDQEIQILSRTRHRAELRRGRQPPYFIGIQYTSPKGEKAGLLLQGDKRNYRAILEALQSVTNLPIAVNENNRASMPSGAQDDAECHRRPSERRKKRRATGSRGQGRAVWKPQLSLPIPRMPMCPSMAPMSASLPATMDLAVGKHTVQRLPPWLRPTGPGKSPSWSTRKLTLSATLEKQK